MKKKVFIYCASGYGKKVALLLNDDMYEIKGFLDNNSLYYNELWGGGIKSFPHQF